MTNRLEVGQRVVAADLAQALEENKGTFACQHGGQTYLAVAREGHSLTSLRPIGRQFIEVVPTATGQEGWTIEKISNQEVTLDDQQQYTRTTR
jgi:hypothetical protein